MYIYIYMLYIYIYIISKFQLSFCADWVGSLNDDPPYMYISKIWVLDFWGLRGSPQRHGWGMDGWCGKVGVFVWGRAAEGGEIQIGGWRGHEKYTPNQSQTGGNPHSSFPCLTWLPLPPPPRHNQGYLDKEIPYWTHPRQFSRFTMSYDWISTIINWLSVNFVH